MTANTQVTSRGSQSRGRDNELRMQRFGMRRGNPAPRMAKAKEANSQEDCSAETPLRKEPEKQQECIEIVTGPTPADNARQVDIQFANVYYSVPLKKGKWKEILHDVTGQFRAGRLTAILGASGSGKTSLLNLIAAQHGNGRSKADQSSSSLRVCYVTQDFDLMPLLTARETIYIAARLKLPAKGHNDASRNAIIEDVADKLGLRDCLGTLASKLSGGERKRLSIAVEIITSPSLLLLDEPTSGLDSASSNQVVSLLNQMARQGCTVACSVHQPSSRMLLSFDDLLIMYRGRCCYSGPRERVLEYFAAAGYVCPPFYNLAEFLLEVLTGQRGGEFEEILAITDGQDKILEEDEQQSTDEESNDGSGELVRKRRKHYAIGCFGQMRVLMRRAFICIKRDNTLTKLRFVTHLIVAGLLGLVFYDFGEEASRVQSNIACIFFFALFLFFANAMPAIQTFPTEAKVFVRENANNWYSLESYYITKILSDLPLQIICPTAFLAIAYYLTGQPLEPERCFNVWVICTLMTILAQSFGIATGAAFNTDAGMFLVPAFNIPMFLFAGFFLKLTEIPIYLQFLSDISYFRYAFEGLLQAIYLGRGRIPCTAEFCYLRSSERILGELDMPSVPFVTTVIALGAWIALLQVLVYCVLRCRLNSKSCR